MKWNAVSLLLILLASCIPAVFAQEIVSFQIVENESVGLTMAPYEKWGMAVHDIDRNGYPDIFCVRWVAPGYSRMYLNNQGVFQEITDQTAIKAVEAAEANTRGILWVDFDNDGDRDLSMATEKQIHLFRNDGNVFTDVSAEVGFVGQKPPGFITAWGYNMGGWADYDLDGDLDCAVTQDNNKRMYLFRNDNGHFTNVAAEAKLDSTAIAEDNRLSWFDFDLDGDPDLHCRANMYRNDGGVFTNVANEMGFNAILGSGITYREFFDYDNDGDFDYFKLNGYPTSGEITQILENRDGVFVDATERLELNIHPDQYRGLTVGDFDNDGDADVFIQNNNQQGYDVLLVNDEPTPGGRAFVNVAEYTGITEVGDNRKGAAFFDFNRDGFLDIYIPSMAHHHVLYQNLADNGANWVGFILEGTQSNRDAVGSLVTLYTGTKKQIRYTLCGNDFTRQDNPWVHFGIGFNTHVDSVVIRWPLGYKQVLTDVAINQYHELKEPDQTSIAEKQDQAAPHAFTLQQNYPNPFNPSTQIRYQVLKTSHVTLAIYDVTGRVVVTLVDNNLTKEQYTASWDGRDTDGKRAASGVYFCRMQAGDFFESRKLVLVQ